MRVIDIDNYTPIRETSVIALGNFDGMHRGHQTLFRICQTMGKKTGSRPSVLLFKTHTREAILHDRYYQLQSLQDKLEVAKKYGIEQAFLLSFDESVMKLSPVQFVDQILISRCNASGLVTGPNYRFGYKASGSTETLQELSESRRFDLYIAPEVRHNGTMINSTLIRETVLRGEIEEARQLLGDYYRIRGVVGPGMRRGRHLGFPTANLKLNFPYCLPVDGVYFTYAHIGDQTYPALTNIGNNPTFEGAERKIETHVLDFSGDLYDTEIQLSFVKFLRPDLRFKTVQALIDQMKIDEQTARRLIVEQKLARENENKRFS